MREGFVTADEVNVFKGHGFSRAAMGLRRTQVDNKGREAFAPEGPKDKG
jgi:hypothetical protein